MKALLIIDGEPLEAEIEEGERVGEGDVMRGSVACHGREFSANGWSRKAVLADLGRQIKKWQADRVRQEREPEKLKAWNAGRPL